MTSFETRAIHVGQPIEGPHGPVVPPISLSTTFAQHAPAELVGEFDYARAGNPTRSNVEAVIASLEGGAFGHAFASGLAAEDAVLRLLSPGDHLLIPHDAYGGTYRLINSIHAPAGLQFDSVDFRDVESVERAWRENTRMLWIETPSNPTLSIVDIAAVSNIARNRGVHVVVDNTFATPYLQRPLELGADIVVHSATKYLSGHSDVTAGAVVTDDAELSDRLHLFQKAIGAVLSPFDSYLLHRGIKTLAVRMDRHCSNAQLVAEFLGRHDAITQVFYPGLASHRGHDVAAQQMSRYGGMVSFTCANGKDAAVQLVQRTKIFTLAESLGAVESLIEHPGLMTHASVAGSALEVDDALVRLSVGLENGDDLIADLQTALDESSVN